MFESDHPITQRENELFRRWRESCPDGLVFDGVADPAAFQAASSRVLLILKEPYSDAAGWDFRETFRDREYLQTGHTWNNAARWVDVALHWRRPRPWTEVRDQTPESRRAVLTKVAFMNLKKTVGGPRSRPAAVKEFVTRYREYLLEQIAIYKPEITVLGGTAGFLGALFGEQEQGEGHTTNAGIRYRRIPALGVAVRMHHPQAPSSAKQSYEHLAKSLMEFLGTPSG